VSSSNSSDPRLLLPEWLRDGDKPASAKVEVDSAPTVPVERVDEVVEIERIIVVDPPAIPSTPFSERLSLDTRLDPGQLVTAADLPRWLGGLERLAAPTETRTATATATARVSNPVVIETPEPYDGVDAPEDGVIDVQVNGWVMVAGAIGLLVLLLAALKLYLS
jgi:hypothetical protein